MTNEQIVLGQLLSDPKVFYSSRLKAEHFSDATCRRAFGIISDLFNSGITPDLLAAVEYAADVAPGWWAEITNVYSSANYKFYEDKIIEAYKMRELALLSRYIQDWSKECNSIELLQELDSRIIQITTLSEKEKIYKASDLSIPFINKLEERYLSHGALPGISTGIGTLDDYTLGLQPRLKYEIGGRPSDGKSALMVTLVCNIAVRQKIPCGIISLESSKEELYTRMIANIGSINSQKIQSGLLGTKSDFASVGTTNAALHDAPIYFYDMPGMTLNDLKMQCRRMVLQHGVKVIFIDYEQLVSIPGVHDIFPRVSEVSITIKNIARELNIPIVSLAQLLRRDVTKRPTMADFKGSGQIEQDADGAILIYHKQDSHGNTDGSYLCVEKMRDGRTGDIPIYFDRAHVRFVEKERSTNYE